MRRGIAAALLVPLFALGTAVAAEREVPRALRTPPGQIEIVTVNARQNAVIGLKRFEDMYELSWALRGRPLAFNGGFFGAVAAPDVIALQEVRTSNVEIFVHLLRQRFHTKYQVIGPEDAASQLIYNPETVSPPDATVTWEDVCSEKTPGRRDNEVRFYQFARFTERQSGAPFVLAAVHIPKGFVGSDHAECYLDNIQELRNQLAGETAPTFIAGDFNRRAVEIQHECDPNEDSPEVPWHAALTQPQDGGRAYEDSVRSWHRTRNLSISDEWTHEQRTSSEACDGGKGYRRSRIDYIFSSGAVIAEAGADDPGWAGRKPGTRSGEHKYSDHRFVMGRFVITGPPRVTRPDLVQEREGKVELTWDPVEGATSYIVYRAVAGHQYARLDQVDAASLSFEDTTTTHDITYRYVIAAVGADGAQGLESPNEALTVDARGPKIVSHSPADGATGVDRRVTIRIVFDERVANDSVTNDRIRLYRGTKRLKGTVRQVAPRVLIFNPTFPLWKGKTHRVVTKPLQDRYGNVGGATTFRFAVEKKHRRGG